VECPSQFLLIAAHIEFDPKSGFRFAFRCNSSESVIDTIIRKSNWSKFVTVKKETEAGDVKLLQNTTMDCFEKDSVLSGFWVESNNETGLGCYHYSCGKAKGGLISNCTHHSTKKKVSKVFIAKTMDNEYVMCKDRNYLAKIALITYNRLLWFEYVCCQISH